jgi:predicted DNA-binding transcriptional regulator YafY
MSNHLQHLFLVFDLIKAQPGITKRRLLERLENLGYRTTARTLERHFTILRDQYRINVQYVHQLRGYVIDGPENHYQNAFTQFAQSQMVNSVFQEFLEKGVQLWDVIGVDVQHSKMNMNALKRLVVATVEHQRVRMTYHKFYAPEPKEYLLEPQYIKQVDKRWYLYAKDLGDKSLLKTFGFERIIDVILLDQKFKVETQKVKAISESTFGVTNFNKPRELVILQTNHWQGKYFETLPIHKSQQITYLDNDICEIKLNIAINPELRQLLASQRQTIKVIAPASLKEDYKAFIRKKLNDLD